MQKVNSLAMLSQFGRSQAKFLAIEDKVDRFNEHSEAF